MMGVKCWRCGRPYYVNSGSTDASICECSSMTVGTEEASEIDSLKSHNEQLQGEVERMREEVEQVVNEVVIDGGITESTPNAVGQLVSTEPKPHQMVAEKIRQLKAERDEAVRMLRECNTFIAKVKVEMNTERLVRDMLKKVDRTTLDELLSEATSILTKCAKD